MPPSPLTYTQHSGLDSDGEEVLSDLSKRVSKKKRGEERHRSDEENPGEGMIWCVWGGGREKDGEASKRERGEEGDRGERKSASVAQGIYARKKNIFFICFSSCEECKSERVTTTEHGERKKRATKCRTTTIEREHAHTSIQGKGEEGEKESL